MERQIDDDGLYIIHALYSEPVGLEQPDGSEQGVVEPVREISNH